MISRIIMVAASSILLAALYYRKKQQQYKRLFKSLNKCQKYHMDYVEEMSSLPINQNVVLFGSPQSLDKQKIINPSLIKKSSSQDRLWKSALKKGFNLRNASHEIISVLPLTSGETLVFNLPLTSRESSNNKYQQRAIMEGVPLCTYGKIKVNTTTSDNNVSNRNYSLIPQLIIGSKHQSILGYLDKQIMSVSKKSKILTSIGTITLIGHAAYHHLYRTKTEIQKQIDQFSVKTAKI